MSNLRNFPNPFSSTTVFGFEHNQPNTNLDVTIDIFNSLGVRVKQIKKIVNTGGSRNCQLNWAGENQGGAKLPKGIYIYRVMIAVGDQTTESTRQLIIL
jgi:flagellar hook assembly protein FlgD